MSKRSSYTMQNAMRFRRAFDEAIRTGEHVEVPSKNSGLALDTLKQRMSEGLLFLAHEIPEEVLNANISPYAKNDYLKLKAQVRMKMCAERESVIIYFYKKDDKLPFVQYQTLQKGQMNPEWRTKIVEYLGNSETMLFIDRLRLSAEDQVWAREQFEGTGIEFSVTMNQIKAIRS